MSDGQNHPVTKPITGFNKDLLKILVCPHSKETLTYDEEAQELISKKAGLAYPIRNGIPVMLIDEARRIEKKK